MLKVCYTIIYNIYMKLEINPNILIDTYFY